MTASHWSLESIFTAPVSLVLLHEEAVAEDARVVHEAVEPAHGAVRPRDERGDVGLVGNVEPARVDLALGRRLAGLERLGEANLVHVADRDLRAGLGETQREMATHALSAARDDDLEVFELHGAAVYAKLAWGDRQATNPP